MKPGPKPKPSRIPLGYYGESIEFRLSRVEVQDQLLVGEIGDLKIPVQVVSIDKDHIVFRKRGQAQVEGYFEKESLADMKDRIGEAQR